MNFKLIVLVVLAGGILFFFGMRPADLLNQGGSSWEKFSGDFLAIFNGEAKNKLAQEIRGNAVKKVQTSPDAVPVEMGEDMAAIARDINRDRNRVTETVKVIDVGAEELKLRMEEQRKQIE